MLKIENLVKRYGNSKYNTVDNLNLELKNGEIFGFLGPNGAGKSTTIKCIVGILPYNSGDIFINGFSNKKNPQQAKMELAYISDNHAVFERLTGREYVNHIANLYKIPLEERQERADKYVKMFNLEKAYDNQIKSYSHGMKQKITVVAALVHNPKLWVLDEPLLGLDPQSSIELKNCMREHAKNGNTVFFSSHILELVESLCDRVGILVHGRLQAVLDLHELKKANESLEENFIKIIEKAEKEYADRFKDGDDKPLTKQELKQLAKETLKTERESRKLEREEEKNLKKIERKK